MSNTPNPRKRKRTRRVVTPRVAAKMKSRGLTLARLNQFAVTLEGFLSKADYEQVQLSRPDLLPKFEDLPAL